MRSWYLCVLVPCFVFADLPLRAQESRPDISDYERDEDMAKLLRESQQPAAPTCDKCPAKCCDDDKCDGCSQIKQLQQENIDLRNRIAWLEQQCSTGGSCPGAKSAAGKVPVTEKLTLGKLWCKDGRLYLSVHGWRNSGRAIWVARRKVDGCFDVLSRRVEEAEGGMTPVDDVWDLGNASAQDVLFFVKDDACIRYAYNNGEWTKVTS